MDKKNDKHDIPYFIIFIAFGIFWPLGIFLLLYKFGIVDSLLSAFVKQDGVSQQQVRKQKYKIMTAGRNAESIERLANAVGISTESCMRDLQAMVANGEFGPEAYINYLEKTLVLRRTDSAASSVKQTINSTNRVNTAKYETVKESTSSSKKSSKKSAKEFKPFGALPAWLLIIGSVLSLIGFFGITGAVQTMAWFGFSDPDFISSLLSAVFFLAGGAASFISRSALKRRVNRMKSYTAALVGHDYMPLSELASVAGVNVKTVTRDLEIMIEKGLLGSEAYIDQGDKLLILKAGASPSVEVEPETPEEDEDRYRAILREIREVNDAIPDPELSARIDEIENLTASIFNAVKEKPEKLPQIRSFMSYYLPTTLKLLHSYADFDKNGADGDNVRTAKSDIERILDMLADGFKKQLDKLYETDAMDISSDINVLENMLRRDGLSDDGSDFGGMTMGGH